MCAPTRGALPIHRTVEWSQAKPMTVSNPVFDTLALSLSLSGTRPYCLSCSEFMYISHDARAPRILRGEGIEGTLHNPMRGGVPRLAGNRLRRSSNHSYRKPFKIGNGFCIEWVANHAQNPSRPGLCPPPMEEGGATPHYLKRIAQLERREHFEQSADKNLGL